MTIANRFATISLVLASVFILPSWKNTQPAPQIRTFTELMNALTTGATVRGIFHYAKCQLIVPGEPAQPGPEAIGGMTLSTWEYFAKGVTGNEKAYVAASETKLISRKKEGKYIYLNNYVKVKAIDDNTVEILAQYVHPTTFETRMDETFICKIDRGLRTEGVEFYIGG